MIRRVNYEDIMADFSTSVNTLIDDLIKEIDRIKKEDPDPERTAGHKVDRMIQQWFKRSGGLGY